MRITIDTERGTLECEEPGHRIEYGLFAPEAFHLFAKLWLKLGWNLGYWATFSWMGRQLLQFPDDSLRLAEAVWELEPDVVIETGVYDGGSTLLFAALCRMRGRGHVIAVEKDLRPEVRAAIESLSCGLATLLEGDSASAEVAAEIRSRIRPGERVFVLLDSDHSRDHVAAELHQLAPLVTPGSYIVVADSNLPELSDTPHGHTRWTWDNPDTAVESFLHTHPEFIREPRAPLFPQECDFTQVSYFTNTWLKRRLMR